MTAGRVVIAEDEALFREGLGLLLERAGYEVAGQAGDVTELAELVRKHLPDLVIVDVRMPPTYSMEGLEAARLIRQEFPDIGIVVLSGYAEARQAVELVSEGHHVGYLLKQRVADVDEFLDAMGRIAKGGTVIDPVLVQELIRVRRTNDPLARLSGREREVLALMAEGRSNAAIADRLFISEGTIEKHVNSIFTKLDLAETPLDHRRVLAVLRFLDAD
jgi:DNA-binding NarL/FixJ family response regulator